MIGAIVHQLTRNLTPEQIKAQGFDAYFVDFTTGVYPQSAGGAPFSAMTLASKGDPITDLTEDMAAEQKARTTYDNILSLVDDPDIIAPIRFLREREVVHFQRFGEALGMVRDHLDSKNYYSFNINKPTQNTTTCTITKIVLIPLKSIPSPFQIRPPKEAP